MNANGLHAAKGPILFVLMVLVGAVLGWILVPAPPPKPLAPPSSTKGPSSTVGDGGVRYANMATFDQDVLASPVPVLVDFYADWCGPCTTLAPTIEELAREMPNARFVKINIDREAALAARYGVSAIPRLLVFRGGQIVADHTGTIEKSRLRAMLDQ